jgi:hypothetical protein
MVLVLSSTTDTTTDLILDRLSGLDIFRFNIDRWRDYSWRVDGDGYTLSDPSGRTCVEEQVRAVYLRKLIFDPAFIDVPAGGSEEHWARQQVEQVWLGIRDLAFHRGILALVHPSPNGRWSKIRQMRVAARHFPIPEWETFHKVSQAPEYPIVVKTFAPVPVGGGALMDVREVDPATLSPEFPWFVQRKVTDATHDVTVAWVNGRIFAYEVDRETFAGDFAGVGGDLFEGLRTVEVLAAGEEPEFGCFHGVADCLMARRSFMVRERSAERFTPPKASCRSR